MPESRIIFLCDDELRQFFELIDKSTHDGRVVADLFDLAQDPESVKKFLTGYEAFLHALGDPAFLPHPSRWAYSMSRIYLQVCRSDLVAATATLDIALVPAALLYYFHPTVAMPGSHPPNSMRSANTTIWVSFRLGFGQL